MTPELKAVQLVMKMRQKEGYNIPLWIAEQCALIAVDEIIDAILSIIGSQKHFWKSGEKDIYDYWQAVKAEIEKL